MFTRVHFFYRDASNYKYTGEILVAGKMTLDQIKPHLLEGDSVLVCQLGRELELDIPHPGQQATGGFPTTDDHVYVEIDECEIVHKLNEGETPACTASRFIQGLKQLAGKWDIAAETKTLEIPSE